MTPKVGADTKLELETVSNAPFELTLGQPEVWAAPNSILLFGYGVKNRHKPEYGLCLSLALSPAGTPRNFRPAGKI